jgi:hypothetical protein
VLRDGGGGAGGRCSHTLFSATFKNSIPLFWRGSASAWLLESRVRIPLSAWMFVSCAYILYCPV